MVGIVSDIGNYRLVNEDAVGYFEDTNLRYYIVADGMGGHNAGEVASNIAVNHTINFIKEASLKNPIEYKDILKKAIEMANTHIYLLSKEKESYCGMGTTVTACLINNNKIYIANVGDSSCIVIKSDSNIEKITKDHSLVQELIDSGSITIEQALRHPNKNIITRALGTNEKVRIDIYEFDNIGFSKIILCSDGLTNGVSLEEILTIVTKYNSEVASKKLVELSKENGSKDNISVIVFEGADKNDR
ncbi:Stp1/IreP family PP2C-type Ser/Thr phosphatase [Hathewaya histolytica]|uniref:Stp1/IreP family PP2C-type Ser/Thr phosphatase n=1 Tax=Hathewaya histolytica TaxID=1498 RepID=UPI003B67BFC2